MFVARLKEYAFVLLGILVPTVGLQFVSNIKVNECFVGLQTKSPFSNKGSNVARIERQKKTTMKKITNKVCCLACVFIFFPICQVTEIYMNYMKIEVYINYICYLFVLTHCSHLYLLLHQHSPMSVERVSKFLPLLKFAGALLYHHSKVIQTGAMDGRISDSNISGLLLRPCVDSLPSFNYMMYICNKIAFERENKTKTFLNFKLILFPSSDAPNY